jgi:hypothetical protein
MKKSIFSQEMASSFSHNNHDSPLATLLEWYKIRDTFFGENYVDRNIPLALELASSCQHPDARWLAEACAGKDVVTFEDAKKVFSALGQNDARALCFLWMLEDPGDLTLLHCSAELGFAFAQAFLAPRSRGNELFKFAQLAAAQGEMGFSGLELVVVALRAAKRTWTRQRKTFCLRANLVMFRPWIGLELCLVS